MKRKISIIVLLTIILGSWGILYAAEGWYEKANLESSTPGSEWDRVLQSKANAVPPAEQFLLGRENNQPVATAEQAASASLASAISPTTPDAIGSVSSGGTNPCMGGGDNNNAPAVAMSQAALGSTGMGGSDGASGAMTGSTPPGGGGAQTLSTLGEGIK